MSASFLDFLAKNYNDYFSLKMKKVSLNPMKTKTQTKQQAPKVMSQTSHVIKPKPDLQAEKASAFKDKVKKYHMLNAFQTQLQCTRLYV